jgi:hypothetical protein
MIIHCEGDYWAAQGVGPLRFIAVEARTRGAAMLAFLEMLRQQLNEISAMSSTEIH